jgi:hypothetical protein
MDELPSSVQAIVRGAYDKALKGTFIFCATLAIGAFFCSLWIKEWRLVRRGAER